MSDIFISYARSTAADARIVAEQLRALGDARSVQAALNITVPFHRHVPRSGLHRPRANDLVGAQLIDGA